MSGTRRPNTAVVVVTIRVPDRFTAADARKMVRDALPQPYFLDFYDQDRLGVEALSMRISSARIERP